MLTAARALLHGRVLTHEGELVPVRDLYFTDEPWIVRYIVVDVQRWLPGHQALISTCSVTFADLGARHLATPLSLAAIRGGPLIDPGRLMSPPPTQTSRRSHRRRVDAAGGAPWITDARPTLVVPAAAAHATCYGHDTDQRVRSLPRLIGYTVATLDRDVGCVDDVLVDCGSWEICYVVVDTSFWVPGRRVLLPMARVALISPADRAVYASLTGAVVRGAPTYDSSRHVSGWRDASLLRYYSRASSRAD